jgi:hypothetical protein
MVAVTASCEPSKVLEQRPEAHPYSVEDLVREVRAGRVRVAEAQRPIHWDVGDALELLDSIDRGYPIGTLLVWQRNGPAQRLDYGTLSVDAPALTNVLWVVDGQQRVQALVRVLAGAGFPKEEFALYFDLEHARFVNPRREACVLPTWIPLNEIVNWERLRNWIRAHPDVDRAQAIRLGRRVREYQIPTYLIHAEDEHPVRVILSRLNKGQKLLQDHEVFAALRAATQQTPRSSIDEISRDLANDKRGFGVLPIELLRSMMLATLGTNVLPRHNSGLSEEAARAALDNLGRAAPSVIHFLRNDAAIPHIELLPYTLPLLALTRLFHFHRELHPRSRELLVRWVWRGALSGQHRAAASSVQATLEAIVEGDEHGSVRRLLATLAHAEPGALPFDSFRFQDAGAKILTLALWSLGPRSVTTGEPIGIDAEGLFPPAVITSALDTRHVGNRIIYPTAEGGSHVIGQALLDIEDPELLESHALTLRCLELLRLGEYDSFLALRSSLLAAHVSQFIQMRARFGENDRPPIIALIIDDDELEVPDD